MNKIINNRGIPKYDYTCYFGKSWNITFKQNNAVICNYGKWSSEIVSLSNKTSQTTFTIFFLHKETCF